MTVERKITALKRQKKNEERVSVYLDGEFAFGLPIDAAIALRTGQMLSEAEIAALQDKDRFARLRDQAMRYLELSAAQCRRATATFAAQRARGGASRARHMYLSERRCSTTSRLRVTGWSSARHLSRAAVWRCAEELYARGVDAAAIDAAIGRRRG
jgi:hypothetical protein